MDDFRGIFRKNLNYYIENSKFQNKSDFGDLIGIKRSTLSNWCKGVSIPSIELLPVICSGLNITINQLLSLPNDEISADEHEMLELYRSLSIDKQKAIKSMLTK
ncbi:MAG: helix-turn-helix transcriptional regulator [bacterium]